jgi:heme-degrading monooxygenase HmoA
MRRSRTHARHSSAHELSGLIEKQLLEGINVHNGTRNALLVPWDSEVDVLTVLVRLT